MLELMRNRFSRVMLAGCAAALFTGCGGGGGDDTQQAPRISVTPSAVSFVQPFVGKTYAVTLSVGNTGSVGLNVTDIVLNDTTVGGGALTKSHPALPFVILPGTPETITVTLTMATDAVPSGEVVITSNDPETPTLTVPISATMVDNAALDLCVLLGSTITDGCDHDPADPVGTVTPWMQLGTINQGQSASKTVLLWNSAAAGNVPVTISAIAFDPPADPTIYTLEVFTKTDGVETPVTLPVYLSPPDAVNTSPRTELRARVTFHALVAEGPVSGTNLLVTTTHPAGSLSIPITATVGGCPTGFADCDANLANGCEVDTASDLGNCGGCGMVCGDAHATPTCSAGACTLACKTEPFIGTFANCDGNVANGCEVNISTDTTHCGSCTIACSTNHATPLCAGGACGILACESSWADCNTNVADGCETSLSTTSNCGGCNNICTDDNMANAATYACVPTGSSPPWTCAVGTCNATFTDMDKVYANGCECQDDAIGDTCETAFAYGSVGETGTGSVSFNGGKITPLTDSDWIQVSFSNPAGLATSCAQFHPRISIADATGSLYFDVVAGDCATPVVCNGGGDVTSALKGYEASYTTTCDAFATDTWAEPSTFRIRVYSLASTANTCLPYTLTFAN